MSDRSDIEWTDATWNPVRGCQKISPGRKHCYAETFSERFRGVPGHPFEQGFDLRLVPGALDLPRRWRTGRLVFVNSMSDLFQDEVPHRARADHRPNVLRRVREDAKAIAAKLAPVLRWSPRR
jgi:protein gp37